MLLRILKAGVRWREKGSRSFIEYAGSCLKRATVQLHERVVGENAKKLYSLHVDQNIEDRKFTENGQVCFQPCDANVTSVPNQLTSLNVKLCDRADFFFF